MQIAHSFSIRVPSLCVRACVVLSELPEAEITRQGQAHMDADCSQLLDQGVLTVCVCVYLCGACGVSRSYDHWAGPSMQIARSSSIRMSSLSPSL
mmetsp:Transcript_6262/g.15790  ORF Transcript_6262/g.15790 Transcript_6262/m.15790 type:complete len:95 (-) Transcript_6262:551-835(-)